MPNMIIFRYGSRMVADEEITSGDLLIVFFCVMIGAMQLGQVSPNFEAVTAAKGAAFFVYKICARVSFIVWKVRISFTLLSY